MPTYTNGNAVAKPFPGYSGRVEAGADVQVIKYAYPVPSGFTLTSHLPRTHLPWEKLHAGALPVAIDEGVAKFAQVEILNKSGAVISVVANDDTDEPYVIPDGEYRLISQDCEIDAIDITGDGGELVYVYGRRIQ